MSTTQQQPPQQGCIKVDNTTLTKEEQDEFLRRLLPACQPQEGSPANTFTKKELEDLRRAVGTLQIEGGSSSTSFANSNKVDIRDVRQAFNPPQAVSCPQDGSEEEFEGHAAKESSIYSASENDSCPQELSWHGAPRLHKHAHLSRAFRESVRAGNFYGPTNGVCPGFLQCNLVVLPQGKVAFDFLLFCQRNPKACPLIEVCDVGSPTPHGVAPGADLRTDVPRYSIYRNGKLEKEVSDATEYWPKDSVAFLIGCSFSYDGALMDAEIPLKSAIEGKNVPMYKTNLKCRSAGSLKGNMVVSMKPIPALKVSKHIEITSKYTHAHGGPVAVGSASSIGIKDIYNPEWGEAISVNHDEVPVFHACGVTPQSVLMDSKVEFAITHSPGHMFVTDLDCAMGV